jgi:hypothetical protein
MAKNYRKRSSLFLFIAKNIREQWYVRLCIRGDNITTYESNRDFVKIMSKIPLLSTSPPNISGICLAFYPSYERGTMDIPGLYIPYAKREGKGSTFLGHIGLPDITKGVPNLNIRSPGKFPGSGMLQRERRRLREQKRGMKGFVVF